MDAAAVGIPVSAPQPTQLTFEDGLGERRYAVGSVGEPLEVLKLSSVLSSVSSFDFALRERTARLAGFRHDAYGRVRSIDLDRRTSALLVTSDYVKGIRLSTLLAETQKRAIPLEFNAVRALIRQLVTAAAALHQAAPDVGNGAIAPERIVLTSTGRVTIVEYVLGAALEQLGYTRARYWRELAVALPGTIGTPLFDPRTDVTQVGAVALALILGRPLTPEDYPDRLVDLIQTATMRTATGAAEPLPASVRDWLTQTLQLDQWESFASPSDARAEIEDAFGPENPIGESAALQLFLARYAAADLPPEPDLGPRLEAMKAFLARYPSRRAPAKTGDTPEESAETTSPAADRTAPPTLDRPPSPSADRTPPLAAVDRTSPPTAVDRPAPPAAIVEPQPPRAPFPSETPARDVPKAPEPARHEPTVFVSSPAAEVESSAPDVAATITSHIPERRAATFVRGTYRLPVLAAAAGLLLLIGALGLWLYFRGADGAATGTLSVTTTPPGIPVFVDDAPHGVTPLGVELSAGEHIVELRSDRESRRIPITVTAGGQVTQYFEFASGGAGPSTTTGGELLVRTDPLGASVTVDGKYVGRSPVSVPDLAPGTHTVVLQNDSGTQTERVIIENGRTASLVVSMGANKGAAAGWIRLEVPTDVQVFENGRLIGSSDFDRIMLPVGRHELELVNSALGYRDRRTVQVTAGQTTAVRPEWPRGSMAINAVPWAEVFVDGNRVGETPLGNVPALIGPHEILFRHPELGERRVSVTVTTGEPLKVGVDLRSK